MLKKVALKCGCDIFGGYAFHLVSRLRVSLLSLATLPKCDVYHLQQNITEGLVWELVQS